MNLTPREKDKLLISVAAMVARGRLARGVRLNHPEAIALVTDYVVEGARDGRSVADLMRAGAHVVTADQCMEGIARDDPRRAGRGDLSRRHQARDRPPSDPRGGGGGMIPGEIVVADGEIVLNADAERITLEVANTGDRPVQIGSHYHFAETNPALGFDREAARGHRLDIAAGTAIRFEPGQSRRVPLVPFGGDRVVVGFNGQIMGEL